jgi:hypothetical protein
MEPICLKHYPQDLSAEVDVYRFASFKNLRRKLKETQTASDRILTNQTMPQRGNGA